MKTKVNKMMNKNLGQRIKLLREEHGLTQVEIAERLDIPQPTYANYERGARAIPLNTLNQLCSMYGVKVDDFVNEDKIVLENPPDTRFQWFTKQFEDTEFTKKQQERLIEYAKFILSKRND